MRIFMHFNYFTHHVSILISCKDSGNVRGMMGNFNDDPSDDLQSRSGTVVDPDTATEGEIYQAYLTCESL